MHNPTTVPMIPSGYHSTLYSDIHLYYGLSRGTLTDSSDLAISFNPEHKSAFFFHPTEKQHNWEHGIPLRIVHDDQLSINGHTFRVHCPPDYHGLDPLLHLID